VARFHTIQTNFTGGEFSPRLRGRIDISRYNNAVEEMRNTVPLIYGGAVGRDGTIFCASTKDSTERARLVSFVYNTNDSYILEFGNTYIRFYREGAQIESAPGVPYEIGTSWSEANVANLNFAQQANSLYVFSGVNAITKINRFEDALWSLSNIDPDGDLTPVQDVGERMEGNWTLAVVLSLTYSIVSTTDTFINADIGRIIQYKNFQCRVTAFTDARNIEVLVLTGGGSVPATIGNSVSSQKDYAIMLGSPKTTLTPSGVDVDAVITLTAGVAAFRNTTGAQWDKSSVSINGGLVRITSRASTTVLNGVVVAKLAASVAAVADSWELRSKIWSDYRGYPTCGVFAEQRLIAGGSEFNPVTLAASGIADYGNFEGFTTNDDQAFIFDIANSQDRILQLFNLKKVIALDSGNLTAIEGGVEKPMTPTNIQIKPQSADGANSVAPERVGDEMYFVHRSGKKLISATYDISGDGFNSTEASKIAEHIANIGIADMAYQRSPYSILWLVLNDGQMGSVTIDKEENVLAWALHFTDGEFESVACIPGIDGDELWVTVKRVIDEVTKRQVERFDPELNGMDSAIVGTSELGANVWDNLGHLEGKEVTVLADGVAIGLFTVTDAEIDIGRVAFEVKIGIPFRSWVKLLPVEVASPNGTSQGKNIRNGETTVRFLETLGASIGDQTAGARQLNNFQLDEPLELFTGEVSVNELGWEQGGQITIEQNHPLPMHVLSVVRRVSIND
jgi:hypothetical protein